MGPNDFATVIGAVAILITAIGGLAIWKEKSAPPPKSDDAGRRIEAALQRMEAQIAILLDRTKR